MHQAAEPASPSVPPRLPVSLWRLRLLGRLDAHCGSLVATFPTRAVVELLAWLVLHPGRTHSRVALIDRLWPDASLAQGRNRLSNALSLLRQALRLPLGAEGSVLVTAGDTVALRAGVVSSDIERFRRHLASRDHAAACAAYGGPLLPGFDADWLVFERGLLQANYADACDAVAAGSRRGTATVRHEAPPPPVALVDDGSMLPRYLTPPHGLEADIQSLSAAIRSHRIVVVTGPGGVGKTRLCIETAQRARDAHPVVWVGLEDCTDAARILDRIAAALDLQPGAPSVLEQLVQYLGNCRALLVLDNLEQFDRDAAGHVLEQLVDRLAGTRILASSQRLPACRCHPYPLAPLPVPDTVRAADALSHPALALFWSGARSVRSDFNIHERNISAVVAICRASEGLPLAIDLAAARVRALSLEAIADELSGGGRTDLRREGRRARGAGRHVSLVRTIEATLSLLDAGSRAVLAAVTVFRGGWHETDAAAVSALPLARCRELLAEVASFSLVQTHRDRTQQLRQHLPAGIRDVVARQLPAAEAASLRARHREHFLAKAQSLAARRQWPDAGDEPNLLHALESAVADGDAATAVALAIALAPAWQARGTPQSALALLQTIVAAVPRRTADLSRLLGWTARLSFEGGSTVQARRLARRALALCGDDAAARADAMLADIGVRWRSARNAFDNVERTRAALALAGHSGDAELQARAAQQLGAIVVTHLRDPAAAGALFEQAQMQWRSLGDEGGALAAEAGLFVCLLAQQRADSVVERCTTALAQARRLQRIDIELLLLNRLGVAEEARQNFEAALDAYREQCRVANRCGLFYQWAYGMWNQCLPLARSGQAEVAARQLAFSQRYWTQHFGRLKADDRAYIRDVRGAALATIDERRWRDAWAQGLRTTPPLGLAAAAQTV